MSTSVTFTYTGSAQSFVVPAGVTSLTIELWGASGGSGNDGAGGLGGYIKAIQTVTPGETIQVNVGDTGESQQATAGSGAFNGGGVPGMASAYPGGGIGTSAGGGGGATDVRRGGTDLAHRIVVAGGGGGGTTSQSAGSTLGVGGDGGSTTGESGFVFGTGTNATGGTQSGGGTAGTGTGATAGASGTGGTGATTTQEAGGGGGGGYYGGGGGGASGPTYWASGAGGSSFASGTIVTNTQGVQQGRGQATITYIGPGPATWESPESGTTLDLTSAQTFAFNFVDTDGLAQSAFDMQYRVIGAGSWTAISKQTTAAGSYTVAANTFTANNYELQVRTYDTNGTNGPWSASLLFTAASPPAAPTVTAPVASATIAATPSAVSWSDPGHLAYQVRRVADVAGSPDTTNVYWDSGQVADIGTNSIMVGFPVNRVEHVEVRYLGTSGLWSPWTDHLVTVSVPLPTAPTLVLTVANNSGSIFVTVTDPTSGAAVTAVDIYRRIVPDTGPGIRIATGLTANPVFPDYTPASGADYEYQAVAFDAAGGQAASVWTA